ncbi:MAG TPA: hypothetical protein VN577_21265 [Terriglobales bacterium]|nr:hypothetical protein [Terriglobales bacterium]
MTRFFTHERFGSPQFVAGFLLLLFLAQCVWFCAKAPLTEREVTYVLQGQRQWRGAEITSNDQPSPATALAASFPLLWAKATHESFPTTWKWFARMPFMFMGALFGASLWYVARRLYGNVAGYIALVLYAFSPLAVVRASTVQSSVIADWGAFGLVFTAIGLAHTLYAPREVVLWNWKRILLLGTAIGLGSAAQFAIVILVPVTLLFMWYLVPERRGAATVIMAAGCAIGFAVLFAAYGFHAQALVNGIRTSSLFGFMPEAYVNPFVYSRVMLNFLRQPTSLLLFLVALATYAVWKRARFFGTTSPLLVFAFVLLLGMALPHQGGLGFYVLALPFGYVFTAGVITDLLESKHAAITLGLVIGILLGHLVLSFGGLIRM